LDWTSTWYVPDESTDGERRIAAVEHIGPTFPGPVVGKGACYIDDEVIFTADVDTTAEHCQKWFPKCAVPGICPLPSDWRDPSDAGPHDVATEAAMSTDAAAGPDATVDASMPSDASRDATQGG
jgi:hypothetical protein